MQQKETHEACGAAAEESVTISNAISSIFPGDNTMWSSNVNPALIGNPADFAMLAGQHYYFLRESFLIFVQYNVETCTHNYTIDATNDLPSIFRSRTCAALSQQCAILGMVLVLAVD
jgi:hypothetical protein